MYVSKSWAQAVRDECDNLDWASWKGSFVSASCRCGTSICGQGCLPRLWLVYGLTSRAWEPRSLTKHPGAIFTPLLQAGFAGKGRQRSAMALASRHWQPLCSCRAEGPCHTHTKTPVQAHTHTGPCMYLCFYFISLCTTCNVSKESFA